MDLPTSEKKSIPTDLSLEYGTPKEPGYHTLASLMGRDNDYAIFRKFSSLNMLNLMSMQAELLELEEEYKRCIYRNEKAGDIALATNFKALRSASSSKQKEVLDKIRKKLDEYNTALAKCEQVNLLAKPRKSDLKFIRNWLYGSEDGEGKGFLKKGGNDIELLTWSNDHDGDFASLTNNTERDIWSSKIVAGILKMWHATCGRRRRVNRNLGIIEYSGLEHTTKLIVTVLSAIMPAVSIIGLYFEKNLLKRIYIMIGLTLAFATTLSVFTGARRIEVFSATAAFAAVEVIFIGSTDLGNKTASNA